jgi:hypothetical protein
MEVQSVFHEVKTGSSGTVYMNFRLRIRSILGESWFSSVIADSFISGFEELAMISIKGSVFRATRLFSKAKHGAVVLVSCLSYSWILKIEAVDPVCSSALVKYLVRVL